MTAGKREYNVKLVMRPDDAKMQARKRRKPECIVRIAERGYRTGAGSARHVGRNLMITMRQDPERAIMRMPAEGRTTEPGGCRIVAQAGDRRGETGAEAAGGL